MARSRTYSDKQLEIFAYTFYRNALQWPNIKAFRETYECSYERAERAIREAQLTASAAVEVTLFEALAVYAGFIDRNDALVHLEKLRKAPGNLDQMKKADLKATVAMLCPLKFTHRATADELRQALRDSGIQDDPEENLNKREQQIRELYESKESPWPIPKCENFDGYIQFKYSVREYVSERSRREHFKPFSEGINWNITPGWKSYVMTQASINESMGQGALGVRPDDWEGRWVQRGEYESIRKLVKGHRQG